MAIPQSQKVPQSIMRLVLAERERGPGAWTGTWNVEVCADNLDKCLLSFSPTDPKWFFTSAIHSVESYREHPSFASLLVWAITPHWTASRIS